MFTDPLTDDDLYWIGYIRADGCLFHPRPHEKSGRLVFSQKYEEPVASLRKFVGEDKCKISKKIFTGGFAKGNGHYSFSSRKGYKELLSLSAKTGLREDIYDSRHFWRGLIDGDGSICLTTGNGGKYPAISLTLCGSKTDMKKYLEFTSKLEIKPTKLFDCAGSFKVAFGSFPTLCIIHHLYFNSYSALPYKRELAKKVLLWRPTRGVKLQYIHNLLSNDAALAYPMKDQSQGLL